MNERTRREFLGLTLPGSVALGAGLASLHQSPAFGGEPQTAVRSYGAGKFALEIDGVHAGWLESVDGGDATADVVLSQMGPGNIQKHLARLKYNDIVLTCGCGMSKGFYDWIKAAFDRKPLSKNGAIVALDFNNRVVSRMEWGNGLISEVGFPACDGSSKDAAVMTVKITPALTRFTAPSAAVAYNLLSQKRWSPANFRLQITGCPTACSRVSAIDAIVLKWTPAARPIGVAKEPFVPGSLEVPNLAVTTAEADAAEFFNWHEQFVVNGQNTKDKEKTGTLDYLAADLKPFFSLSFSGLGIFKLAPEKMTVGAQTIRRVRAEMYCDVIGFSYGAVV
jgi:hypothetical protein